MASVCKYLKQVPSLLNYVYHGWHQFANTLKQNKSLLHGQWIAFLGSNSIIRNVIPLVDDSALYDFL